MDDLTLDLFGEPPKKRKPRTGVELRDDGLKLVADHNKRWRDDVLAELRIWVLSGSAEFTLQDFRICYETFRDMAPSHHNAWGTIMMTAVRRGWVVKTGNYRKALLAQSHARQMAIYRRAEQ